MLKVENLQMTYAGEITALKETTLTFERGNFNVLLGTSGAGKSTLLRCLNFLNVPTSGSVITDALGEIHNTQKCLRLHRKSTAMIFQQHQLIGRHTALANVLMGFLGKYSTARSLLPLKSEDKIYALECLERVDLLDKALTRVDNLSGGQQQRVGIARALAQRPQLILADEPVASLDPETSDRVLSIFHRITKEDRITAIVSLHQVELAKQFGDRVIGLSDGTVVFDGKPTDLTPEALQRIYVNQQRPVVEEHKSRVAVTHSSFVEPAATA